MWKINANDVINLGRSTTGGDKFTEFVDAILRAHAVSCQLQASDIKTNLRVNKQDGGVDTEVQSSTPNDTSGWLQSINTYWQYKATDANQISDAKLKDEVNKWHSTELIKQGYALRFCICDSIAAYKRKEWENTLSDEIHKINSAAPKAIVLTADDLANWANNFLDIILRFFRPQLSGICRHVESWKKSITQLTPKYVPIESWNSVVQRIKDHINWGNSPPSVILPIFGESGVGKSRLVYEVLSADVNTRNHIVYTDDEYGAIQIARMLANEGFTNAIIVADECPGESRAKLEEITKSLKSIVRIIAIDNAWDRPRGGDPNVVLENMSEDDAVKILALNYPNVPDVRRRAYARLSKHFIRFAAYLCDNDISIVKSGSIDIILGNLWDYLKNKLSSDEILALQALSLVKNVGMKDDVTNQLIDLCKITSLNPEEVKKNALKINQGSGFIAKAGRFFYVTPEIIAQLGFDMAWNCWAVNDPQLFLQNIPQSLLDSFCQRVASSAKGDVRRFVGDFFREWANSLHTKQLASLDETNRLVTLIETDASTYLPLLRRIAEDATDQELLEITGESINGKWGPRRSLVWLLERLAAFPESFNDAEYILLRFALAETEPKIGNNSTNQWKQLFRIVLSGTAIPFKERLALLRERVLSKDNRIALLGFDAIDQIFDHSIMKVQGPAVVGGRITPSEWKPKTNREWWECQKEALSLLKDISLQLTISETLKERVYEIIIRHLRSLLAAGQLDSVQTIFEAVKMDDNIRIHLSEELEEFIHFEIERQDNSSTLPKGYIEKVYRWYESLSPQDLHEKLAFWVGKDPWHHSILKKEKILENELIMLASECLKKPDYFNKEIGWLCSPMARSSSSFGLALGKLDSKAIFLNQIIDASVKYDSIGLQKGYIGGLLISFPEYAEQVNKLIDKIEKKYPELAYELFIVGGDLTKSLARTLELVDSKKLAPISLRVFSYGIGNRKLRHEECKMILQRLILGIDSGDQSSGKVAIEFLGFHMKVEEKSQEESVTQNSEIREIIWDIVQKTVDYGGHNHYWWGKIMLQLVNNDPDRAICIISKGILSDDFNQRSEAEELLTELGGRYPEITIKHIEEIMDDEKRSWLFFVENLEKVFGAIPDDIVIKWAEKVKIDKIQKMARHLPTPFIDNNGVPVVPKLTEYILEHFENDERTFNEFCAGVHSGQTYWGDIADQHEKEADVARKFLNHHLKRIRQWAERESKSAMHNANWARQHEEEFKIEDG